MQPLTQMGAAKDYPAYPLSIRIDIINKNQNGVNPSSNWKRATLNAVALATHCASGYPIAVSQYKGNYRTQANAERTRVLGLDFDAGLLTAEDAAKHPLISKVAAVVMPTASDTPDYPKTRALIFLDRSVTMDDMRRLKSVFMALLGSLGLDPTVFETGRFFYGSQPDPSRVFVAPYHVLCVDAFLAEHSDLASGAKVTKSKGESKGKALEGDIDAELDKLLEKREALLDFEPVSFRGDHADVLDKLQYVARLWHLGEISYGLWFHMWVSAHRASGGSEVVRDYILAQPQIWTYDDGTQADFERAWDGLADRDYDKITGATLNWLARRVGWGSHNPYARMTTADHVIDVVELADGFDLAWVKRGDNVAIKSQTGSGKTKLNAALIKRLKPEKAVVISPFIHLCHAVARGMNNLGIAAVSYDTKGADDQGAAVVVRTPQNTLKRLPSPEDLEYVFIEEIHALLQHLVKPKGDGGHMSDAEREGFRDWLMRALTCKTCTVVMVDAGLTDVSVGYLRSIADVKVVHNTGTRHKAAVTRVDEQYAIDHAIETLQAGKKVVVNAPSKKGCERIYNALAPYAESAVLITADTKEEGTTRDFRDDVEAGAASTQLVVYNAAMGTGVSIEDTTPDLIVQYADFLSGSAWIQHLNRYRSQKEVLLVMTLKGRHMPRKTFADHARKGLRTWREEIKALGLRSRDIPAKDREAKAFEILGYGLAADLSAQVVDAALYYEHVLEADGRQYFDEAGSEHAHPAIQAALKLVKEKDKTVLSVWRDYPKINPREYRGTPVSAFDYAAGYTHYKIDRLTYGQYPKEGDQEAFARTVLSHETTIRDLEASMRTDVSNARGLEIAINPRQARTALRAKASKRTLVQMSRTLITGLYDEITPERLRENAAVYVAQIADYRERYDVIVGRERNSYKRIAEKHEGNLEDMAIDLLKYVLASVGLKLRSRAYRPYTPDGKRGARVYTYYIENRDETYDLLLRRERGRTNNPNLEHIASTFGVPAETDPLKAHLDTINRDPEMKKQLGDALREGADIYETVGKILRLPEYLPF